MTENGSTDKGRTHSGENVVIAAGDCSATLLPALGGKIASLRAGNHELLHPPLRPYQSRTRTMPYEQGDAGGWDECLPSVAACTVSTEAGPATIPDHGDLWRVPWEIVDRAPDSVTLRARCFSLPLELTRSILLAEAGDGWRLHLLYTLANRGDAPVPWAWSAHPLFQMEPGDRIALPNEVHTLRLEGSRNQRLGRSGDSVSWPIATLADGSTQDLSQALSPQAGTGDKLFAGPTREGWCTLDRPSIGLRIGFRFDPALTPWLGLWICYGGWPEGDGPRQVGVAPEPTTAPVDSLAEAGPWTQILQPGATITWPMEIEIEPLAPPVNLEKAGELEKALELEKAMEAQSS